MKGDDMRGSRLAAGVAASALVALGAPASASATHAGGSDSASCVAWFVHMIPPGARGQVISVGDQDPQLHPFGRNAVSQQARAPCDNCIVFPM